MSARKASREAGWTTQTGLEKSSGVCATGLLKVCARLRNQLLRRLDRHSRQKASCWLKAGRTRSPSAAGCSFASRKATGRGISCLFGQKEKWSGESVLMMLMMLMTMMMMQVMLTAVPVKKDEETRMHQKEINVGAKSAATMKTSWELEE